MILSDRFDQLQAIHFGHLHVRDDDVRRKLFDRSQRQLAVTGFDHGPAGFLHQQSSGQLPIDGRIVDDENGRHFRISSRNEKSQDLSNNQNLSAR